MARNFGVFSTNDSANANVPRGQVWATLQTGNLDELHNPTLVYGVGPAGQVKAGVGAVGLPGYTFHADPDTGLYQIGADNLGVAIGGAKKVDISSAGTQFGGSGARLAQVLTGVAASWATGAVAAGVTVSTTVTVTGAVAGDFVLVSYDSATGTNPNLIGTHGQLTGVVTANDTVTIKYTNGHASSTVNATVTNLRAMVLKAA